MRNLLIIVVAELQTPATFTGWDFSTIWFAPSAGTYPDLR
jgi:hypothetical protein